MEEKMVGAGYIQIANGRWAWWILRHGGGGVSNVFEGRIWI